MKSNRSHTLTKGEIQVMNILWDMPDGGSVNDVMEMFPEPKPAYTTIATYLKILLNKNYVTHRRGEGKKFIYHPVISREEYTRRIMSDVKENVFRGSRSSFLKFFVTEENISEEEIRELLQLINEAPTE